MKDHHFCCDYDVAVVKHTDLIPAEMDVNKESRGKESTTHWILDLDLIQRE